MEFSNYKEIENALNCKSYFCDLYCHYQKWSIENTNGLISEFYQKGMNLSVVNKDELKAVQELLNNRPRKCINYKTPKENLFGIFT